MLKLLSFFQFTGLSTNAFADAPALPAGTVPAVAGAAAAPGIGSMLMPMALMFGVVYFLMIRPQQKKAKEQQSLLTALQHGDEVITTSGLLGTVRGITEKVVTLEVADNVKVKMLKSQVAQVLKGSVKDLTT
jgi:preprotein translocase subunit YajC